MVDARSVFLELCLNLSDDIGTILQDEADWSPELLYMEAREGTFIMSPGSASFITSTNGSGNYPIYRLMDG